MLRTDAFIALDSFITFDSRDVFGMLMQDFKVSKYFGWDVSAKMSCHGFRAVSRW